MRRYGYFMGLIYSTCLTDSLKNRSGCKETFFFFNTSSDESFYIIELNLVSLFLPKTESFPNTMKMSEKVSKVGDIVRNV